MVLLINSKLSVGFVNVVVYINNHYFICIADYDASPLYKIVV